MKTAETIIKSLVLWKSESLRSTEVPDVPIIGSFRQINSICMENMVDRVVVALDERRGKLPIEQLLFCRLKGISIDEGTKFTEDLCRNLSVENIYPSTLIFSDGFKRSLIICKVKRGIDIICSFVALLLFLPVCMAISIAIKLESRGPVFYRQERVGQDGIPFNILKFRSMNVNAEENGPVWTKAADERITKVGRFIRKLRLDEIPQMINVLKGDMSFVGPRPERPFFVEQLQKEIPFYSHRHSIKPGITGWAQICYRYGASKEDTIQKLKFDLYYLKHMNIFLDIKIILKTIEVVFLGKGAR